MSRSGRNFGVQACGSKALFCEDRIVIAMDDVVGDAGMVGLLRENGLEDLTATAMIREGLVRLGSDDVKRECMKNRGLRIVGVSGLQFAHLLLES